MSTSIVPVELEVLRHGLEAAAEEMGVVLARAAFSPNIKERRDHSCAVFDADGSPVAQAEHIPVHLGAMPFAVSAVREELGELAPGDVAIVNDPYRGGTHLPDLTMVAPVHADDAVLGYVAARAHHADIGGRSPGSMPAGARTLDEEGLVLAPELIVRAGAWDEDVRSRILEATRTPQERRGDLAAQHGALVVGARRLVALAERHGAERLATGMAGILEHTERLARARLAKAEAGTYRAEETLEDDGAGGGPCRLAVRVELGATGLVLDYEGTSPQVPGNLNAPVPVTLAGALYVLRVVLGADVPSNAGLARCIDLRVPEGTVLNPRAPAAVAGGNVETSQRNVDLLFQALAPAFPGVVPAPSQGTMNNVTLGGPGFTYYETLGGGEGGTPTRAGASGIHTHMTNTRNTPIEAMEHDLPIRVLAQTLRRGSGGEGRHPGGDGLRRELEVLTDGVEANLITSRRTQGPTGLQGGAPGAPGANTVIRANGAMETLAGIARVTLDRGDRLVIETPGGGGWGT